MSQIQNNQKLSTYFYDHFRDFATSNTLNQAHSQLSNFVQTLITQDEFLSNNNSRLGHTNLDKNTSSKLSQKTPLNQTLKRLKDHKSTDKQTILVTLVHQSKTDHSSSVSETTLEQGLRLNDNKQMPQLLVYYRNAFYLVPGYLSQGKNKSFIKDNDQSWEIKLQKNVITTSQQLPFDHYDRIIIQPQKYYNKNFPSSDFTHLKTDRKYSKDFAKENPFLKIQNINYTQTSKASQVVSQQYVRMAKQKLQIYKDNTPKQQQLLEFHQLLKNKLEYLVKTWDSQNSSFRIALVKDSPFSIKRNNDQPPSLFIYNKIQQFQCLKTDNSFLINLEKNSFFNHNANFIDDIRLIKELLLLNMIYRKNKTQVDRCFGLKQNISSSLYQSIKSKQQSIEISRRKKIDKIKQTPSLRNFSSISIQNFFKSWKSKIQDASKTPIIAISPNQMYLTTDYKYTKMQCKLYITYEKKHKNVNNEEIRNKHQFLKTPLLTSTSQSIEPNNEINIFRQVYNFTFDQDLDDWDVKLIPQDPNYDGSYVDNKSQQKGNLKNICFDLSEVKDLFKIKVLITPIKSNETNPSIRAKKIEGYTELSKIQKIRMIGQHQELALYEVGGQAVGFLNLFYRVKQYLFVQRAEDDQIHKQQKIKFLENIGKIPANYFQTTVINYTPNQIPFFAHLLATQQQSITHINFQNNYVSLIEFLSGQKKSLRRDQIMEQQKNSIHQSSTSVNSSQKKQFTVSYYQRIDKYQELLGISQSQKSKKLSQKLSKSSYPGNEKDKNEQNLIRQYIFYQLPSSNDQISLKTFGLMSQSLKVSMSQAQKIYCPESHLETLGVLSTIFSLNESNLQQIQVSVYKNGNPESPGRIEQKKTSNNIKLLQAFNPYLVPIINRIITLFKVRRSQFNQNYSFRSESSIGSQSNESLNQLKVSQFTINFLSQLYPYFNPRSLQKQCLYIRYFVQKYLPELNFNLNRKHIGLQNFVAKYLLSLFSMDLQEEITFTIWDFIISSHNKFSARINCILTLLIFMQKTSFHPVIPVSGFAKALIQNYQKFDFSNNAKKISQRMLESLGELYQKEHKRKKALYELRDEKGNLLIGNDFVRKVMFDTQRANKVNFVGNKKVNLNDLSYRLPEPKFYGYAVEQIKVLLKGIFISDTVPLNDWSLVVKWHNMTSEKVTINQKNQNINEFIRFKYPKELKQNSFDLPPLEFIISPKKLQEKCFIGYLPILNLHKDYVYCEEVRLIYVKDHQVHLSNKGQNILHLQLILKSKQSLLEQSRANQVSLDASRMPKISATVNTLNLRLEKEYYINEQKRQELVYDRLLDYDLEQENSDALKEMKRLKMQFNKMKNPIDQFTHEKYDKLKIPSVGDITFPQVVMNSQLLIEHFQALIDQTFPNSKSLKANLPEIYKLFSKNTNYQMIYLTEILIEAILIDRKITFQQKIEYLYCLGKHYQNTSGTGLTVQTVDFIFTYIFKTYGWLTGVPYTSQGKGQIVQGVIYAKGLKVKEQGLDITNILRDWAHICKIKYGNLDLVLGDSMFLTSLRSLLPVQTIQSLQSSNRAKQLRIEIIYEKNQSKYIWSACVDISDFRVKQVGTKFLQRYPPQAQLHSGNVVHHRPDCSNLTRTNWNQKACKGCSSQPVELDTASEILYNCNNLISLESSSTINKTAFKKIFYTNSLVSYLLNYSSVYEPTEFVPGKPLISKPYEVQNKQGQTNQFKDWVLYRYQNCIEQWRKCNISITEGQISYVQMPDEVQRVQKQIISILRQKYKLKDVSDALMYKAPAFEVWSMEQNLADQESTEQSENLNEKRKKNQRQAMRKVTKKN